jgi:DNA-binding transcriptional regulator YhcF (GntR family)
LIKERLRFEGCEEVREEGIAIGMEEEIEEELLKAVSNMIKKGFSDQDIIEILDISKDKLTLLRKQIGN